MESDGTRAVEEPRKNGDESPPTGQALTALGKLGVVFIFVVLFGVIILVIAMAQRACWESQWKFVELSVLSAILMALLPLAAARRLPRLAGFDRTWLPQKWRTMVWVFAVDGAVAALQEAVRLDPGYGLGHYDLASAYLRQGKTHEALQSLRKAIQFDPSRKKEAAEDKDFAALRNNPEFKQLVGP